MTVYGVMVEGWLTTLYNIPEGGRNVIVVSIADIRVRNMTKPEIAKIWREGCIYATRRKMGSIILIACLLLTSCLRENRAQTETSNTGFTQNEINAPQTRMRIAEIKKQSLGHQMDIVCGMTECEEGFVIAGEKGGVPVIQRFQQNGAEYVAFPVEVPAGSKEVRCVGEGVDGGFCALFATEQGGVCSLVLYDKEGRQQGVLSLTESTDYYIGAKSITGGNVLIWTLQDIYILHKNSEPVPVQIPEGAAISAVQRMNDDTLFVIFYDGPNTMIAALDATTGTIENPQLYGNNHPRYHLMVTGNLHTPMIYNGRSLQQVNIEDTSVLSSVGWAGGGLCGSDELAVIVLNETTMIALSFFEQAISFVSIQEQGERQTITVGAMQNGYSNIEMYVGYFNATNDEYSAQIKYYDEPQQLAADFISGNAPDVVEMMHVTIPINEVHFLDMEELMQAEPHITPQDFTGNVYEAMQIGDKTLFLTDLISIDTATARTMDVGTEPGWTMKEFQSLMEEKGDGYAAFPAWLPPIEMLHWISFNAQSEFVDYETYTCNFENEGFVKQLQLCRDQPDEDSDFFGLPDHDERIIMRVESIVDPVRIGAIKENYGVYEYVFIGFPNNSGKNGSFFSRAPLSVMLAIPATSRNPSGAWRFVCGMYDDAWQTSEFGLPVMRIPMENALQEMMNNEDWDFSETDYAKIMQLLEETDDFVYQDEVIGFIIEEEAQAFLAGDIDAWEAARRIQNRVTVYLEEIK